MVTNYRLVGITKPRSATLQFLDTDKITFWAKIDMPDDVINNLFEYCKGNWGEKKIAVVKHDGLFENGTPIFPVIKEIKEQ